MPSGDDRSGRLVLRATVNVSSRGRDGEVPGVAYSVRVVIAVLMAAAIIAFILLGTKFIKQPDIFSLTESMATPAVAFFACVCVAFIGIVRFLIDNYFVAAKRSDEFQSRIFTIFTAVLGNVKYTIREGTDNQYADVVEYMAALRHLAWHFVLLHGDFRKQAAFLLEGAIGNDIRKFRDVFVEARILAPPSAFDDKGDIHLVWMLRAIDYAHTTSSYEGFMNGLDEWVISSSARENDDDPVRRNRLAAYQRNFISSTGNARQMTNTFRSHTLPEP